MYFCRVELINKKNAFLCADKKNVMKTIRSKNLYKIVLPCAFIIVSSGVTQAQTARQQQKDSLWNVINEAEGKEKLDACLFLSNLYMAEAGDLLRRDSLFRLYDLMEAEVEKQADDKVRGLIMNNKIQSLSDATRYDEIVQHAPGFLAFTEEKRLWTSYYQIYENYIRAVRNTGDNDRGVALIEKMYEEAKERNHPGGMALARCALGGFYAGQRRFEEQEELYRESIRLLREDPDFIQSLSRVYVYLSASMTAQRRFEEAGQAAREAEQAARQFEKKAGIPQPNALLYTYRSFRDVYQQSLQFDKSEKYCDIMDSLSDNTCNNYEARAFIYASREQYDLALEMADKSLEAVLATSTIALRRLQALCARMIIVLRMNNPELAEQQYRKDLALQDSIYKSQLNEQLNELRIRYEVEKITAEKIRQRNYFLFAAGGCILLSITLGIWIYYTHAVNRKNRGLYRQIREQSRMAEEMGALVKRYEGLMQHEASSDNTDAAAAGSSISDLQHPYDRHQWQLVNRFYEYLLHERRFTNFELSLNDIIPELGTNRTSLFNALKAVTGKTPNEYIRDMQLEEAQKMLASRFELTVDAIAEDCGIPSRSTFYRLFNDRYQISPTVYRKLARTL